MIRFRETGRVTASSLTPTLGVAIRAIAEFIVPLIGLLSLVGYIAYAEGTRSSRSSREITGLNDRAAEILGSLLEPPDSLDDYNITVLSATHKQQVTTWLKQYKKTRGSK